jgi:DNA-binding transcriptional ArsR family regulator
MAAELLARVRAEIDARLAELRPVVAEYERLLGAAGLLDAEAAGAGARSSASPALAADTPAAGPRSAAKPRQAAKPAPAAKPRPAAKRRRAAKPRAPAKPRQAPGGAAQQAIVAALEHGSHTLGELVLVTAMSGPEIRESLKRLQRAGTVTRARREGRAAYALSSTV